MPVHPTMFAMLALVIPASALDITGVEWAGVCPMASNSHTWSMQKTGCGYADESMKVVMIPTTDVTLAGLEAAETEAATLMAGTCTVKEAGESMKPASGGSCFDFHVGSTDDSLWTIDTTGLSGMVFFAQHVPTEFERDAHYLYSGAGTSKVDVDPVAQETAGGDHAAHDHRRRLSEAPHAGHDHGGGSMIYEWAGVFPLADVKHVWSMQKVGGVYAAATMKLAIIPSAADASEADANKALGETLIQGTCTVVEAGGTMKPAAGGSCFELHANCDAADSFFNMDTTGLTAMTVFAQHVPLEFERSQHFLKDSAGADVDSVAFEKRWGIAIGAALLVNVVTLSGVILAVPVIYKLFKDNPMTFGALTNAFAAGALISCAFFLMFPEGYLYVGVGSPSEGNTAFMFGLFVLLGVITASIVNLIVHMVMGAMGKKSTSTEAKDVEGAPAPESGFTNQSRILSGVLIGDVLHNFFDGTFIGVAFSGCSNTMAWGIVVATILHEIAQELADYVVLTDPKQGKLKPPVALGLNFISGLSGLLGVVVVMSMDIGPRAVGCGLVFGGGIYIQVGLAECMGRVYAQALSVKVKLGAIILFCLGALAIGLVLINHVHCVPEGDASHEAHDR